MRDEEDIVETLDEFETPDMPEAPQSISVSGYYKGFKSIFTIRKESNKSVAVTQTQNLIDALVENGWKPSWNEDTNVKLTPIEKAICQHPEDKLEKKISHSEKNNGKEYMQCSLCKAFVRWA